MNQKYNLFEVRVTAFVFNKNEELLLVKNGSGQWGLISGHLEKDEGILDALERESFEEANITLGKKIFLENVLFENSLIIAYACNYRRGKIKSNDSDIKDVKWVKLDEIDELEVTFEKLKEFAILALKKINSFS